MGSSETSSRRLLGPWVHLVFFTSCFALIFFDRGFIAGSNLHLKDSLGLTDFQLGLIGGMFILGYVLAAPLFALLGQVSGKWTIRSICIGLLFWVVSNILIATLPSSFFSILACRTLTGVGEAAFAALTPPIIDDVAPIGKGSTFLGIFFMSFTVGQALGYVGSGFFHSWETGQYAFLGEALIMVVFIGLTITWQDRFSVPSRSTAQREGNHLKQFCVLASNMTYVTLVLGYSTFAFTVGGLSYWSPAAIRVIFSTSHKVASIGFGALTVSTGLLGTFSGGYLLDLMCRFYNGRKTRLHVACVICFIFITISIPFAISAAWSPYISLFFVLMFFAQYFLSATTAQSNVAIMEAVPTHLRSQALAASFGVCHILGDFPSPILMGLWNDRIGYRASLCICSAWLSVGVLLWACSCVLSRTADSVDTRNSSSNPGSKDSIVVDL